MGISADPSGICMEPTWGYGSHMDSMWACWQNIKAVQAEVLSESVRPVRAIDNMVKMLESYTTRLENIVYERNQLVVDEKKKADSLLYSILPRYSAQHTFLVS